MKDLSHPEMEHILKTVKDGVLALTNGATPYCLPFGFVFIDGAIFISFFPKGRKWDYIQKNNCVCFNVFHWNEDRTEWASVVIDGVMEQVTDLKTIEAVVIANTKKMGLDPEEYVQKRMDYYKSAIDNPKGLKIFRIKVQAMGGKKMQAQLVQK